MYRKITRQIDCNSKSNNVNVCFESCYITIFIYTWYRLCVLPNQRNVYFEAYNVLIIIHTKRP